MSGQATRWFSETRPHNLDRPPMSVELVELLGGHPQLQDRKPALGGRTAGRVAGRGYSRAVRAAPGSALSPALSLHSTSPAELSSGNILAPEADHGKPANRKAPVPSQVDHMTWPRRHRTG